MEEQVKKTGLQRHHELQAEAKKLGITTSLTTEQLETAIAEKGQGTRPAGVITPEEAAKIKARLELECEIQEKFKAERQMKLDHASIVAESESLKIPIDLPENPTELQLQKARRLLGMKKLEVKPSPETLGIEKSKRGYYVFTNREQDDAAHTVNLGGKYIIHLIPDQVHVLSEYHVKAWKRIAVVPKYGRVPTGVLVAGQMGEKCVKTGSKPRFMFEYLGEAPQDALFGLVTDTKILDELMQPL